MPSFTNRKEILFMLSSVSSFYEFKFDNDVGIPTIIRL
jgi:glutaredoxin-related protein